MVLVALAGPGTNVLLAIVSALLLYVLVLTPSGMAEWFGRNLVNSLQINAVLCVFNMLPLPPLDGGSVFSIFLPEDLGRRVREFQNNGSFSIIGLLVAWRLFPYLTDPIFTTVLKLVHPGSLYE